MTQVFMTGATGNAGGPVLNELLKRGHDVTAMVRSDRKIPGCETITADLANLTPILDLVAASDGVIHLASPRGNNRESVIMQDIFGTGALIDAWSRGNFVYASSQTVYGIPEEMLTESSSLDAICWYDLGKLCNEFQLRMAEPLSARGAAVSLRMALLFSAGDRRHDRQFLPGIYEQCCSGEPFVLGSDEEWENCGSSFIGDQDFGRAVVDALDLDRGGPYNIATGFCTWRELIEAFDRHLGTSSRFVVRPSGQIEAGEYRLPRSRSFLSTDLFDAKTGFEPQQSLDELVECFLAKEKQISPA